MYNLQKCAQDLQPSILSELQLLLCLVNYKRAIAEFCKCALLDACMEAHTCLSDVYRAIWCSWYDSAQRTMVKSALIEKLASVKAEDNRVANLEYQPKHF